MSAVTLDEIRALHIEFNASRAYTLFNPPKVRNRKVPTREQQMRMESLTRADAHISRCSVCGTQTWNGRCGTCARFAITHPKESNS